MEVLQRMARLVLIDEQEGEADGRRVPRSCLMEKVKAFCLDKRIVKLKLHMSMTVSISCFTNHVDFFIYVALNLNDLNHNIVKFPLF